MKLICPNCGEFVPGPDIDLRRALAVCRPCGEVVPLPQVLLRGPDDTLRCEGSALFTAHEICALPLYAYRPERSGLRERRQGQRVIIERPDDRVGAGLVLMMALVWCSLLTSWPETLRDTEARRLWGLWLVFALIHVSSAGYLVFLAVRGLCNTTRLSLSPAKFTLEFAPLPRSGALSEATRDIRCFVESSVHIHRLPERWFRPPLAYDVMLLTRDQRSIPLNMVCNERDEARYLALRLNRALDEMRAQEPRPAVEVQDPEPERPAPAEPTDGEEPARDDAALDRVTAASLRSL